MHEDQGGTMPHVHHGDALVARPPVLAPVGSVGSPRPDYGHTREIQKLVAAHWNMPREMLLSRSKVKTICRPRMIAMGLCRAMTPLSYPELGGAFGGRDHTTVIHAVRRVKAWVEAGESDVFDTCMYVYRHFRGPRPLVPTQEVLFARLVTEGAREPVAPTAHPEELAAVAHV